MFVGSFSGALYFVGVKDGYNKYHFIMKVMGVPACVYFSNNNHAHFVKALRSDGDGKLNCGEVR